MDLFPIWNSKKEQKVLDWLERTIRYGFTDAARMYGSSPEENRYRMEMVAKHSQFVSARIIATDWLEKSDILEKIASTDPDNTIREMGGGKAECD